MGKRPGQDLRQPCGCGPPWCPVGDPTDEREATRDSMQGKSQHKAITPKQLVNNNAIIY